MRPYAVGFLGAGNMAEALTKGILAAGRVPPAGILASDVSPERAAAYATATGARTTAANADVAQGSETIVLSIKPQVLDTVLREVGPRIAADQLVVSIVAGATIRRIESFLPKGTRVVRTMPNTPVLVGKGVVGICRGSAASAADLERAKGLFEASAAVFSFEEPMLDAVTALSGSGPAYLFYLAEGMIEAGTRMGIAPPTARAMVQGVLAGSARLLETAPEPPEELRRRVTSPGGTTEAAIRSMEGAGVRGAIVAAILAAEARGRELGKG